MNFGCPNQSCSFYLKTDQAIKAGQYFRKSDSRKIQRYRCKNCGKKFSRATFTLEFGQNKRRVNQQVYKLYCSKVSCRRIAKILNIHRNTVHRKIIYLQKKCLLRHQDFLKTLEEKKVSIMQFDDLISSEHTKLKPVTCTVAVDVITRKILSAKVSRIGAFGHLAEISRKKYGHRKNTHNIGLTRMFEEIKNAVEPEALIQSDEHKRYPEFIEKYFPNSTYQRFKSSKSSIHGQGELKKIKFDPLFAINHTFAMLRDNLSRLARKTWCNTKKAEMLENHLCIYIDFHNRFLV